MAGMRLEQVQSFILAKKKNLVYGHFKEQGLSDLRRRRSTKTSPQNITWLNHKSFGIIQSRSRPTIWTKYPKK